MMSIRKTNIWLIALLLTPIFFFTNCNKSHTAKKISSEYYQYFSSYTTGVISKKGPVRIEFSFLAASAEQVGQEVEKGLFSIHPKVAGTAIWDDRRMIKFTPDDAFEAGKTYTASVDLHKANPSLKIKDPIVEFDFEILQQNFTIDLTGFDNNNQDLSHPIYKGGLQFTDYASSEKIEQIISAKQNGTPLDITWTHDSDRHHSDFQIKGLTRTEQAESFVIEWNAKPIGLSTVDQKTIEIPALGDFKIMGAKVISGEDKFIQLNFSDPLLPDQNLDGLVSVDNYSGGFRYIIEGSFLKIYPTQAIEGDHTVTVSSGIKNIQSQKMKLNSNWKLSFVGQKPAIQLSSEGNILPNSEGLYFPFQAVGLNAVDVEIFKIFNNNILQFFQSNSLQYSSSNLRQVGRIVWKGKVSLTNLKPGSTAGAWTTYGLDLGKFINQDKQAIYQVRIGFRPAYSTFYCNDASFKEEKVKNNSNNESEYDNSILDYYYGPSGWYRGYDWDDRENPCKPAYYNSERFVSRNIIASNIGIIAKNNNTKDYFAAVTDLRTTKPIANAKVEFYDFQQQLLATAVSNNEGMVFQHLDREAFMIIAKTEKEGGYLKLRGESPLSLSQFKVGGARTQKGLKGFLYGERGVWRPGDSLYLHFILEDKTDQLPNDYPIEFSMRNAKGQIVQSFSTTQNVNGIYPLHTKTDVDAATGFWTAIVKAGGATFRKTLRIETVKPNRLKIDLDFGKDKLDENDQPFHATLTTKWLHGAPASNLRAKVEYQLKNAPTTFKKYKDYQFIDYSIGLDQSNKTLVDKNLNSEGKLNFNPVFIKNKAGVRGKLRIGLTTRVFEKGGDFSTNNQYIDYSPFTSYAGINLPRNKYGWKELKLKQKEAVKFVVVDGTGKPVPNREIKVSYFRVNWRWWWDYSYDAISRFNASNNESYKGNATLTTNSKGEATWNIKIDYWGRYKIKVCDLVSGHCAADFFHTGQPDESDASSKEGTTMLVLQPDKKEYSIGETAELTIPMGKAGRALVSLENGSKIIESFWFSSKEGENKVSFTVTPDMAPTVYANITLIQPHAQTENDLPMRLYGVVPIKVVDKQTQLKPILKMKDELRPEQLFDVKVSEENGQAMAYTIDIVDDGLLDLTNFSTPAPWKHFYAKEALGINTWDLYQYVIGAQSDKLQNIISVGGDGEMRKKGNKKKANNRFKPVVLHLGPFHLKKGQTASHQLKMPNYVGSVRAMVVAAANDKAYGHTEKTIAVRKPLMVLATLPRVLSPGETVKLPVDVFAMKKSVKDVKITVEDKSGLVTFPNGKNQNLHFDKIGDKVANFEFTVGEAVGEAHFLVNTTSGKESSYAEIQVEIRNPNPYTTKVYPGVIAPGKTWTQDFSPVGMKGTNEGILEVSGIPPISLEKRLKYLLHYPYGCIEQTTSSGFPQLYLDKLVELTAEQKVHIPQSIQATIQRIRLFQTNEGGFSYWPGQKDNNQWATNYAGHFLLEAKKLGYTVPNSLLNNWAKYQKKAANMWSEEFVKWGFYNHYSSELNQAYRLFTLALMGKPEMGAMNKLRAVKNLSTQAKWRLAAAYAIIGQSEQAQKLAGTDSPKIPFYRELSYTYGSNVRDMAMILETQLLIKDEIGAAKTVKYLSEQLNNNSWQSTQTLSYSLMAIGKFVGDGQASKKLQFAVKIGDHKFENTGTEKPIMQLDVDIEKGTRSVSVKNTTEAPLFVQLINSGQPISGTEEANANDVALAVQFLTMNGQPLNANEIPQGTDFIAQAIVTHKRERPETFYEMALTQVFPSGWEIINSRMTAIKGFKQGDYAEYTDVKDDRVNTFFDLSRNNRNNSPSRIYNVQLNAAYQGKFYLPAASCEAMYDHSISANNVGQWVEVIAPK